MPTLITSLHHKYQPTLDALWACREIGSNAIDGEERNRHLGIGALTINYSKRSRTLTIHNEGVTVSPTALLMGTSESRSDELCIGQFGEGLPMALLVFARSSIPVVIYNGDEKWEPSIEKSEQYDNEPVLCIKTRKMLKDRGGFEVQIQGIDPEEYESFCSLFLRFDPEFDPTQTVHSPRRDGERVLLQPDYTGKIYNKGVFVQKRGDLMFGYDLRGELNRDRSFMDEWTLKSGLGSLLASCISENGSTFIELVSKGMFESNGVLEVTHEYSDLFYSDPLRNKVCEIFEQRFGNAIPVNTEAEAEEARSLGLKAVLCSPLLSRILYRKLTTLATIKAQRQTAVIRTWREEELGEVERTNFITAKLLVQSAIPASRGMTFTVVSFGSVDVRKIVDTERNEILVAHTLLLDFESTLIATVEGALYADTRATNGAPAILCRIIGQLTQGSGAASLALNLIGQRG